MSSERDILKAGVLTFPSSKPDSSTLGNSGNFAPLHSLILPSPLIFCVRENNARRPPPLPIHRGASSLFLLLLINSLCWVVSPPTYERTRCLTERLAVKWRVGRADSSGPKLPQVEALGGGSGGKMKEKSLIETAKMQGNVLVRWLLLFAA